MLPSNHRLNQEKDVGRVLRRGSRTSSSNFIFLYLLNGQKSSRFTFLVSKKVSNKANKRNLVKRRLRHIIGKNLKTMAGGRDCVLIAKKSILLENYHDLEAEIRKVLLEKSFL